MKTAVSTLYCKRLQYFRALVVCLLLFGVGAVALGHLQTATILFSAYIILIGAYRLRRELTRA